MMTRDEERNLIDRILAGETELFETLVTAHQRAAYDLALRMLGNEQDALDAVQEAFFRAWRALSSFRGNSKFSVWLYRLTSNVCLDMLRRSGRRTEVSLMGEDGKELPLPDRRFDPQTELERKELQAAVRSGLARLEPPFRQALVLREIHGLSYEEIAQITGLEPGTVKSRIFRARRKLAAYLNAGGNFFAAGSSYASKEGGGNGGRL